jgi:hypothetical protein
MPINSTVVAMLIAKVLDAADMIGSVGHALLRSLRRKGRAALICRCSTSIGSVNPRMPDGDWLQDGVVHVVYPRVGVSRAVQSSIGWRMVPA